MDFENHHCLYLEKKNTKRTVKLSIAYKDFHCFEPMGFAHVRFLPFTVSKKIVKQTHLRKNTHFRNPYQNQHNINILTAHNHYVFFMIFFDRPKTNHIKKWRKNMKKRTSSKTLLKPGETIPAEKCRTKAAQKHKHCKRA